MVHVEQLVIEIRVFAEGKKYGDEYIWSATGVRIDEGTIELVGCTQHLTTEIFREIRDKLRSLGWKKLVFVRYRDGERIVRKHDI